MSQSISFLCANCKKEDYVEYGEEETDDDGNLICTDCTAPETWEDLNFPVWIKYYVNDDSYPLLRNIEHQTETEGTEIPQEFFESDSDFKSVRFTVWFEVSKDGCVLGPYDEKNGELIHG